MILVQKRRNAIAAHGKLLDTGLEILRLGFLMFAFDDYRLDAARRELWRGQEIVALEPQVFDLLVYLVANRDRVVSKDDLLDAIWGGRSISDSTMTSRINSARKAIGDTGSEQRRIRTVPRAGFRFVCHEVKEFRSGNGADGAALQIAPGKPSIAVLPFVNMSGDPEQEYFSDGISEEILTALSRLHWLFVIGRNSTFVYKGAAQDVRDVGSELGVRYVLEGSVRKSGPRVRVASQLLDAADGQQIWSDRYDRDLTDIFAVQDEITSAVIGAIEPKLLAAEARRAQTRHANELDAWDEVAGALSHFWRFTASDSATSIKLLKRAVEKHPNYAPGHSMLACALLMSSYVGWTPPGHERDLASTLAYRAVALDESDPWGHLGLGISALMGRLPEEAVRYFNGALDLNPNFATAVGFAGFTRALNGETSEALQNFERAMLMSPRDPFNSFFHAGTAVAHYLDGHYKEAVRWARKAVRFRPEYAGGYRILAASLALDGQQKEAAEAVATLRKLMPEMSLTLVRLSVPYTANTMERFLDGLRKAGVPE